MQRSITLFRVKGIPIGINWSWLLIAGLLTWVLGSALFPATHPGLDANTYLVMGLVAVVLFFLSVLLHELAHALVGVREGVKIEGITLWLLGGVAQFSGGVTSPRTEFRMTVVGPFTSLALAGVFGALAFLVDQANGPVAVLAVVDYLARINLILATFNLVPAMPLDGGRILRSWLWQRQQDRAAATRSATRAGKAFGWILIWIGLLGFFTGTGLGGFWLVILGWFLLQAASSEAQAVEIQETFRGRRVRDLMTAEPATVDASWTIDRFIDEVARPGGHSSYPVVEGDRLVGLMSLRAAGNVAREERPFRTVRDTMLAREGVPVLTADAPAEEALEALQGGEGPGRALVVSDGRAEGIVSLADVARAVELQQLRGAPERAQPARRSGVLVWVVVGLVMALAAGYLYHPPAAVLSPGPPIDVVADITIEGTETTAINGSYVATPVAVQRPNALGVLFAAFAPDREVVPLSAVIPTGADPRRVSEEQQELFSESQLVATVAAAHIAGLDVSLTGTGARVLDIVPDSPASDELETGDVIVQVDGRTIDVAEDLRTLFADRPAGTTFTLTVERAGMREQVEVTTASLGPVGDRRPAIGVVAETRDLNVDLPFDIAFSDRTVGGQSAGLPFALAIADLLMDEDVAAGRTIAATGSIDPQGNVGPVGGLAGKIESAREADADVFLVPTAVIGEVPETEIQTIGVDTLEQAMQELEAAAVPAAA